MDQNGLYDIYSLWHVPFWRTTWFYWTIISLATVVSLIIVWCFYRWYHQHTKKQTPSWQIALQIINDLQNHTYTTQSEGKQCYLLLTNTLKTYLNQRFDYPVRGKTDQETAQYLQKAQVDKKLKQNAQEILNGCVLIKFANQNALNTQIHKHLSLAKHIIESTIPQNKEQNKKLKPYLIL